MTDEQKAKLIYLWNKAKRTEFPITDITINPARIVMSRGKPCVINECVAVEYPSRDGYTFTTYPLWQGGLTDEQVIYDNLIKSLTSAFGV